MLSLFFFNDPATTEIYTLSLHDALPICPRGDSMIWQADARFWFRIAGGYITPVVPPGFLEPAVDRKSTRLNSSHPSISYAVFCLKKKKNNDSVTDRRHPA